MNHQRYLWTIKASHDFLDCVHIKVIAKDKEIALEMAKRLNNNNDYSYIIKDIREIEKGISTVVGYEVIKGQVIKVS